MVEWVKLCYKEDIEYILDIEYITIMDDVLSLNVKKAIIL